MLKSPCGPAEALSPFAGDVSNPPRHRRDASKPRPRLPPVGPTPTQRVNHALVPHNAIAATLQKTTVLIHVREGAEREPLLVATVPSGWWGYLVDGLGLGVVRVEEANELGGAHFGRMRVH